MVRASSPLDLARAEEAARSVLRTTVDLFEDFPTEHNEALVVGRMRRYRDAWMNGRVRP